MFGLFKKKSPPKPNATQIVPRIKHKNFLEALSSVGMGEDDVPVTEPLIGDLLVTYAFDLPEMFQMVRRGDLRELGMSENELRAQAVANLKSRVGQGGFQGEPPVLRIVLGENFDACSLLYEDLWPQIGEKIPPEIIVGVPHRDAVLLTTTSSTKGGLAKIREMVDEIYSPDDTHALTRDLFVYRDGKWEVFDRPLA